MSGTVSALNPNISLGASAGQAQGPGAVPPPNPLDLLSRMSALRAQANANQQFQSTFAAQTKAGQIIAAAPDLESGLAAAMQDPEVAARGGQAIQTARTVQQLMLQNQGVNLKNSQDAMGGVLKAAIGAQNPQQFDQILRANFAAVPPELQQKIAEPLQALRASLMDGVDGSAQGQAKFVANKVGIMVGTGMSSDSIKSSVGVPISQDTKDGTLFGVQHYGVAAPDWSGGKVGYGIAPQTLSGKGPNGEDINVAYPGQAAAQGPGSGAVNPLVPGGGIQRPPGPLGVPPATPTPSAPTPITQGPSPVAQAKAIAQNTAETEVGKSVEQNVVEASAHARDDIRDINMLGQALTKNRAGGGASIAGQLAQFAQGLQRLGMPITQDMIDQISGGDQASGQIFSKLIGGLALKQLSQNTVGSQRLPEINYALKSLSPDVSPEALVTMLNKIKQDKVTSFDQGLKLPLYKGMLALRDKGGQSPEGLPDNYDLSNFHSWYDSQWRQDTLPTNNSVGGMDLAPFKLENTLGTKENAAAADAARRAKAAGAIGQARQELGPKASNDDYVRRAQEILNGR